MTSEQIASLGNEEGLQTLESLKRIVYHSQMWSESKNRGYECIEVTVQNRVLGLCTIKKEVEPFIKTLPFNMRAFPMNSHKYCFRVSDEDLDTYFQGNVYRQPTGNFLEMMEILTKERNDFLPLLRKFERVFWEIEDRLNETGNKGDLSPEIKQKFWKVIGLFLRQLIRESRNHGQKEAEHTFIATQPFDDFLETITEEISLKKKRRPERSKPKFPMDMEVEDFSFASYPKEHPKEKFPAEKEKKERGSFCKKMLSVFSKKRTEQETIPQTVHDIRAVVAYCIKHQIDMQAELNLIEEETEWKGRLPREKRSLLRMLPFPVRMESESHQPSIAFYVKQEDYQHYQNHFFQTLYNDSLREVLEEIEKNPKKYSDFLSTYEFIFSQYKVDLDIADEYHYVLTQENMEKIFVVVQQFANQFELHQHQKSAIEQECNDLFNEKLSKKSDQVIKEINH